ncbi:MAG: CcdB family protein [Sphingomonadales bacterium]|nr:CcdB family protein [Sphingomonadales bacterium]
MARFDVYPGARGKGYLLDCQADVLAVLTTRVVVPLFPVSGMPVTPRLNPVFDINGEDFVMMTQQIFAIPKERLTNPVAFLADEQGSIMNALDVLLTGV